MNCDGQCPPFLRFFCCNGCVRKEFVINHRDDNNLHDQWTEDGFLSKDGCVLAERPKECLEYDCKRYWCSMSFLYADGKWRWAHLNCLETSKLGEDFDKKLLALFEEYK